MTIREERSIYPRRSTAHSELALNVQQRMQNQRPDRWCAGVVPAWRFSVGDPDGFAPSAIDDAVRRFSRRVEPETQRDHARKVALAWQHHMHNPAFRLQRSSLMMRAAVLIEKGNHPDRRPLDLTGARTLAQTGLYSTPCRTASRAAQYP